MVLPHLKTSSNCSYKMHKCLEYQKLFGHAGALKDHMVTHSKERAHACVQCNKSFGKAQHMKTHMLTHICSACNKTFGRAAHLEVHMLTHSKERPYVCVQFNKSFGQAAHLKTHMLTHSGVKAHTYSECKKAFSGAGSSRKCTMQCCMFKSRKS